MFTIQLKAKKTASGLRLRHFPKPGKFFVKGCTTQH